MKTVHKIGLGLGATALTLGGIAGAAGVAQAADPTPTPTPSASAGSDRQPGDRAGGKGERGGHGQRDGRLATQLAEKLGLDEAKVSEALKTAHDKLKEAKDADQTTKPTREERDAALAKELASALGVDEAKVTEALKAIESEQDADRAATLQKRLDQAVTDGKLTQAEADAVAKAVQAGVIGGGGRR